MIGKTQTPRALALATLCAVVLEHRSLASLLPQMQQQLPQAADRALLQRLVYGTLRYYPSLKKTLRPYLKKSIPKKQRVLEVLLLMALYQLILLEMPAYAVLNESVALAKQQGKQQAFAAGFVNAVLRAFLAKPIALMQDENADHPAFLAKQLRAIYGDEQAATIFATHHAAGAMMLRVRKGSRDDYLKKLQAAGIAASAHQDHKEAIVLAEPVSVNTLPDFADGAVTVQDANAQLAALLLGSKPGMHVLDACAAPGGKTAHILDKAIDFSPNITLLALEIDPNRAARMVENNQRLGLLATVQVADAANPTDWFDGVLFDRILLDAPCSATGVIRKHPDILFHRTAEDIAALTKTQQALLQALWPLLKVGGRLLYATCSLLPEENEQQIIYFLKHQADARLLPLAHHRAYSTNAGMLQFLPDTTGDGFFYALLEKVAENENIP